MTGNNKKLELNLIVILIIFTSLFVISFIFFLIVRFKDPGYTEKMKITEFYKILDYGI